MQYTDLNISPDDMSPWAVEMRRRLQQWAIYNYNPTEPPFNPQLPFHESQARIRLILGSNRSGKTQCPCAEVAATALGPPYPWWYQWARPPKPPAKIWIIIPFFQENPSDDARICKLFLGEEGSDKDGNRVHRPPLIPPEMIEWQSLDCYSTRLVNGSIIEFKASSQQSIQLASSNVDLIFIDEPTRKSHWSECMSRMIAMPGSRLIHCLTDTTLRTDYLDHVMSMRDKIPVFTFTTNLNPYKSKKDSDEIIEMMDETERDVRILGKRYGQTLLVYPDVFGWKDQDGRVIQKDGKTSNWIEPFDPPASWTRYVFHDPGKTNPSAVVWFAVEPNGDIHAYKMLYWRRPSWSLYRVNKDIHEYNAGEKVYRWYIDPKAAKQPQYSTDGDYYEMGSRAIDLYNQKAEEFGFKWLLGPPKLENAEKMERVVYTTAYMDPLDERKPMIWFHDKADMRPLRHEFGKYRISLSKTEGKNNPRTTHDSDNHAIYCVEGACCIEIKHVQDAFVNSGSPLDEMHKLMLSSGNSIGDIVRT